MSRNDREIERLLKMSEQNENDDYGGTSIEERWNMMWQMTMNAFAMRGENVVGRQFQRHVERLERRER